MNFKEKYMQDLCSFESINDEIDLWHETTPGIQASESLDCLSLLSNKPLHEYLGLSFEEYRHFVEDSNLLKIKLDFDKSLANLKLELIGFAHYNPYDGILLRERIYLEGKPFSDLGTYSDAILTKINNPAYTKLLAIEDFLKEKDLLHRVEECRVKFDINYGKLDYLVHADLKECGKKQDLKKKLSDNTSIYNSSKEAAKYLLCKAWESQNPIEQDEIIICKKDFLSSLPMPGGHTVVDQGPFIMELTYDGPFKGINVYFRILERDGSAVLRWELIDPKPKTFLQISTSQEIYTSPDRKGHVLSDLYGWHPPVIPRFGW
jgi:hypothetical protein